MYATAIKETKMTWHTRETVFLGLVVWAMVVSAMALAY